MKPFSLLDIAPDLPTLGVVDIGAMVVEGEKVCCDSLVRSGKARLVGFEPDPVECEKANRMLAAPNVILPYFIADGARRTFYQTNSPECGSIYEPNTDVLDRFHGLGEFCHIVARHDVATHRLDDLPEIGDVDYLKVDVQGAELDVLKGAERVLSSVCIVQTEVEFVELYKGQPLFADIDVFLRSRGFSFHTFSGFAGRCLKPLLMNGETGSVLRQWLWTDAFYIRDFTKLALVSDEKLWKMAVLLHDELGSFDFCASVLTEIARRSGRTDLVRTYFSHLA